MSTKITSRGDYILQAKDNSTLLLQNMKIVSTKKAASLGFFDPPPRKTKMVLEGYPLWFSMNHLEEHHLIKPATCLRVRSLKDESHYDTPWRTRTSARHFWHIFPQTILSQTSQMHQMLFQDHVADVINRRPSPGCRIPYVHTPNRFTSGW